MNTQPVIPDFDEELFGAEFLSLLDREPVDDNEPELLDYLDSHDVHSDGPLGEFKPCKDCSGSTGPTCRENGKCVGSPKTYSEMVDGKQGAWLTIRGRHVFVEYGKDPVDALKEALAKDTEEQPEDIELSKNADAIAAIPKAKRDDMDVYNHPGHGEAYALFEARQLVPKAVDKLKRVTENNSMVLWQDYDYVANVGGKHFGISKYEDSDEPDDDKKFVFAFKRLDRAGYRAGGRSELKARKAMHETTTDQVPELFDEMRKHVK